MKDRRKSPIEPEHTEPHMCTIDVRLDILRSAPFFKGLPDQALGNINRLFVERGYQPDEIIFHEGEPAERLYVVAAGKVKLLQYAASGKSVLLDLLMTGEFFGSLSTLGDAVYPNTASAQTSVCTLSVSADDFRQILEKHPMVALRVLDGVSGKLRAAHEMVHQLSLQPVEHRIAYVLLKLGEKLGKWQDGLGLLIETPLSRDELSEMVGTTPETASRVISQFQKAGLVQSGRQWIAITDQAGLAEMVEGYSEQYLA